MHYRGELDAFASQLQSERQQFDSQVITYRELQNENATLKRDLRNFDVHVRKLQLDHDAQCGSHEKLGAKVDDLGKRYLSENVKWIMVSLTPNNFTRSKEKLNEAIAWCRGIGLSVPASQEGELHAELKAGYTKVVRAALEREEQARIKAQIREDQLRQRELDRELKQLEHEREAIKIALAKALADANYQHNAEVEGLQQRLADAEERAERAISQAQLTKAGHVYVISNLGAFGDGVFKVGMTRRLEPMERILELGGAAVPFPFDVHMMISSDNAPGLENALHRGLNKSRINKTNPRKEFFKTNVATICQIVKEHHGEVEYKVDADALQYRQSLSMVDDDQEFIEGVYSEFEEEQDGLAAVEA